MGGWVVSDRPRPLYLRERDPVHIVQEAGWARGPVWTGQEYSPPTGIRFPDLKTRSESLFRLTVDRKFVENSCTPGSVVYCDVWAGYLNISCSEFVGQKFGLYIFIWCISVK